MLQKGLSCRQVQAIRSAGTFSKVHQHQHVINKWSGDQPARNPKKVNIWEHVFLEMPTRSPPIGDQPEASYRRPPVGGLPLELPLGCQSPLLSGRRPRHPNCHLIGSIWVCLFSRGMKHAAYQTYETPSCFIPVFHTHYS